MLIHIWISPCYWKVTCMDKRSLECDLPYVFLIDQQVYKYVGGMGSHEFSGVFDLSGLLAMEVDPSDNDVNCSW